jgi:lipopolysaccharide/colanic/teichoic acid biosynthesis glycosyltransferase
VGARGRVFFMLKFRKMRDGASGLPLTAIDDERFTRMGAFLARTKIDELPQLWNVLKADMSIVGPRPEDPAFVDLDPATFADVLSVKPGITGLSQLAFARESEILDPSDRVRNYVARLLPAKVGLDRLYAAHRSVGMDARILAWTLYAVILRRDVAVHRGSGRITTRRRTSVEQPQAAPSMASHSG